MDIERRRIAILGSTGSIGTQTLDIIEEYPDLFEATVLTARSQVETLAEQARKFRPRMAVIAMPELEPRLRELLRGLPIEVASGPRAIEECVTRDDVDTVVTAMVGYSGLAPTLRAIEHDKLIALANKETLVAGGELIDRLLPSSRSRIIPVDSEHSAIFQCLEGEDSRLAQKIILTASGGPFRTFSREQIERATVEDALRHPNWSMGAKVTIDSASMMNKGFEMIEAHRLFGCPARQIEVVVHPQSIVHSMVQFKDGSIKAQLGVPDMHLPIRYALGYPRRLPSAQPPLELSQYGTLTFEAPDMEKFPLLRMAFEAIETGGTAPCILNAANEIAVAALLEKRIRFARMPELVAATMAAVAPVASPDYETIMAANAEARAKASELLARLNN